MLSSLRQTAAKWIIRLFVGVIALSFAIWGIADIFNAPRDEVLARVGGEEVTASLFQGTLLNDLDRLSKEEEKPVSLSDARLRGLDREVLDRLVQQAVMSEAAYELGLRIPDDIIAERIRNDEAFQISPGQFDRATFDYVTQANGYTEDSYVDFLRELMTRGQLVQALIADVKTPRSMVDDLHRYSNEKRIADYILLSPSIVNPPENLDEEGLRNLYDSVKYSRFVKQEARAVNILVLNPEDVTGVVDDPTQEELEEEYNNRKRFLDQPERRHVNQLTFPDMEQAKAAVLRVAGGDTDFETLVEERGLTLSDTDIGAVSQAELPNGELAAAVFSLGEGEVSGEPVDSPLGPVLFRVREIEPAQDVNFEDVRETLRETLVNERTLDEIYSIRDLVEDRRAAGETLEDIATALDFELIRIPEITAEQTTLQGESLETLPDIEGLTELAFDLEVGEETLPGDTDMGGFYWVDVVSIDRESIRPFEDDEVRAEMEELYTEESTKQALEGLATELVERGNNGESLEDIAADYDLTLKTTSPFGRSGIIIDFSGDGVRAMFETPKGGFNWGTGTGEGTIFVIRVREIIPPAISDDESEFAELESILNDNMAIDILFGYVAGQGDEIGITINEPALTRILAGDSDITSVAY